jgi:hypothetical protein
MFCCLLVGSRCENNGDGGKIMIESYVIMVNGLLEIVGDFGAFMFF